MQQFVDLHLFHLLKINKELRYVYDNKNVFEFNTIDLSTNDTNTTDLGELINLYETSIDDYIYIANI